MESLMLLAHDIKESFSGITMLEISRMGLCGLWLLILLMPLGKVDRRDQLSGMMFAMFMSFAAAILFYAIPRALMQEQASFQDQFSTLFVIFLISMARWSINFKELTKTLEENTTIFQKKEEPKNKSVVHEIKKAAPRS